VAKPKCSECGAPSGDPHNKKCSKARSSRTGKGGGDKPLPRPGNQRGQGTPGYGEPCPPHNPTVYKQDKDGNNLYRCKKCKTVLGRGL
jgi:hypothetical protein